MSYTNDDLIQRFVRGRESGKANRMAIAEFEGWTLLWGYGHALYGARSPDGTMYVYYGWYGRSNTTSTHMNKVKGKAKGEYGEPRNDGESVRVLVDGEGGGEVVQEPPTGHVLIVVDDVRPGTSYGKLNAEGRPELEALDGRHVPSPNGYGG
jgi:hypothetical protein